MERIRIHGRGGQGVVTAAELIALAAFYEGHHSQAFPSFGVERSGAPIQAFVRIDKEPIITREQIYEPSILIIQDASLLDTSDVLSGCRPDTHIIINAKENRWPALLKSFKHLSFTPATEIALKVFGKNLVNTVILGAFARETGLLSLTSLKRAIEEKFKDKGQAIIDKNIAAAIEDYEETKVGDDSRALIGREQ